MFLSISLADSKRTCLIYSVTVLLYKNLKPSWSLACVKPDLKESWSKEYSFAGVFKIEFATFL